MQTTKSHSLSNGLKIIYLTHREFRQNTSLWSQVRKLVVESFEDGRASGQNLSSYLRAFMEDKQGKAHALILDSYGNVLGHWNAIPINKSPKNTKITWVGHMVTKKGSNVFEQFYGTVARDLFNLGFKVFYGTWYTRKGADAGRKMGTEPLARTVRGKKHDNQDFRFFRHKKPI